MWGVSAPAGWIVIGILEVLHSSSRATQTCDRCGKSCTAFECVPKTPTTYHDGLTMTTLCLQAGACLLQGRVRNHSCGVIVCRLHVTVCVTQCEIPAVIQCVIRCVLPCVLLSAALSACHLYPRCWGTDVSLCVCVCVCVCVCDALLPTHPYSYLTHLTVQPAGQAP